MTTISVDSHYLIGHSHLECQDYTRSGDYPLPYILLSDGCSNSDFSEMGARYLVREAESYIQDNYSYETMQPDPKFLGDGLNFSDLLSKIKQKNPFLDEETLDATLLSLVITKDNNYYFACIGDGVLIKKVKNKPEYILTYIEFPSNAPCYLSYYGSERGLRYLTTFGGQKNIITYKVNLETKIWNSSIKSQVYQSMENEDLFLYKESSSIEDYEYLAISSDGLMSLFRGSICDLNFLLLEAIPELLDFKVSYGTFVKRRLKAFAEREAAKGKQGLRSDDDLSLGVIYFND